MAKKKKKKRAELSVTVTDCRCINLLGTRGSAIPWTCEGPWVDCLAIEMKPRLIFIPTAKASSHQYPPWAMAQQSGVLEIPPHFLYPGVYKGREIFSWGGKCKAGRVKRSNIQLWRQFPRHTVPSPILPRCYSLCHWPCKMVFFPPSPELASEIPFSLLVS